MPSLYDKHDELKSLQSDGYTNIAEMSKHFTVAADMDRALGLNNVVAGWSRGKRPSRSSEMLAWNWMKEMRRSARLSAPEQPSIPETEKNVAHKTDTIVVSCDRDTMTKVKKLLTLMSVEYIDL